MSDDYQPLPDPFTTARVSPREMDRLLLNARVTAHIPKRVSSGWDPKNQPSRFTERDIYD